MGVSRVGVRLRAGCVVEVGLYLLVGGFNLWCLGEFALGVVGWSAGGAVDLVVSVGFLLVVLVGSVGSASELALASVSALGLVLV